MTHKSYNKEYMRNYYAANKERINKKNAEYRSKNKKEINENVRVDRKIFPEKYKEQGRLDKINNPLGNLLTRAKRRAKEFGIEFNLLKSDLGPIGDRCPVLGIQYNFDSSDENKDFSPSLDRIDNTKGYIKSNVCVISWRANRIKNNGTLEEFELLLNYLKTINKHNEPNK